MFAWWVTRISRSIAGAGRTSITFWISSAIFRARAAFASSRIIARPRIFWRRPARWWPTTRRARARTLWTEAGRGEMLGLYAGYDAENEALFIADTIERLLAQNSGRARGGALSDQLSIAADRRSAAPLWPEISGGGRIQFLPAGGDQRRSGLPEAGDVEPGFREPAARDQHSGAGHRPDHGRAGGRVRAGERAEPVERDRGHDRPAIVSGARAVGAGGLPEHDSGAVADGRVRAAAGCHTASC